MNIIEAQEQYLSFKGDQYYALDLINSLREAYSGSDMPKMLNDFVFNLEVALQNAGVLDQDFNLIEEVKLTKKYKVTLGRTEHLQQVIEVEANDAELANEMAWDLSGDWKCVDTEEFLDGIECLEEVKLTRQQLIKALTKYELEWFIDNGGPYIEGVSDFFVTGGFNIWSDEKLQEMYDELMGEEE
jgi:hypothetical protein